jgi:hypothetical protein
MSAVADIAADEPGNLARPDNFSAPAGAHLCDSTGYAKGHGLLGASFLLRCPSPRRRRYWRLQFRTGLLHRLTH